MNSCSNQHPWYNVEMSVEVSWGEGDVNNMYTLMM